LPASFCTGRALDDISDRDWIVESWRRGDLDYKRHAGQKLLTEAANTSPRRTTILHAARGYGKTFDALVGHLEYGLQNPNTRQMFAAINRAEARKIVKAVMPMVLDDCPAHLKPQWVASEYEYRFHNGSVFLIEGVDGEGDNGDHLRGPHIHKFTGDEVGFWRDPVYAYKSVILPQLQRVNGKGRLQSTSPKSVGQGFVELCTEAIRKGGYHKFTVWDNPRVAREQAQADAEELCGLEGEAVWKTTSVRREFLCEFVTDAASAVVPEFSEEQHVVTEYTRPEWVDCYEGLDLGLVDLTHLLYGYWDFDNACLVIEDEIAGNYMLTKDFAGLALKREKELWGHIPYYGKDHATPHNRCPRGRYSDNDAQILYDLASYGLSFAPALKVEKEAALNRLRQMFAGGKVKIHARCVNLIHQLKVGTWNERRTDYERLPGAGHLDGVDALVYMARSIDRNRNPVPPLLGVSHLTHHIPPVSRKTKNELAKLVRR
jgi:hypothetical protein